MIDKVSRSRKALIYLADLSHTGVRIATEAFPLNIGLVASYARKRFAKDVEIRLFKYPEKLLNALKRQPPDILGCSNYTWNTNLSTFITQTAKAIDSNILTVFGGTNYPFDGDGQREFLGDHPSVDICVFYEGEIAFANLLLRYVEVDRFSEIFETPIDGCQFLAKDSKEVVSGASLERIKNLEDIPSPYVTGLLDEFFDGVLTPLMETARGCPFTCNFCNAGDRYFAKVNKFSVDYVREEVEYIAPRAAQKGLTNLTLADNNFGMIPRDREIAEVFARSREKYNWPLQMTAWTGKNSKQRVIEATEILGSTLSVNMAVQSMADDVLVNIKRENISIEAYKAINEALTREGRPQGAELIVPLPGETLETYLEGIKKLMTSEVGRITSYTLQLLYGTPYKQKEYRREHDYVGRWRVVPLDFGTYEGRRIFDTEEVSVSSKTMSFEDYLKIRTLTLTIELCYNDYTFFELLKYLKEHDISLYGWTNSLWQGIVDAPHVIKEVFRAFLEETKDELWESREELEAYYLLDENYKKLVNGERGGNVLLKYKSMVFLSFLPQWVEFMFSVSRRMLQGRELYGSAGEIGGELEALKRYVTSKLRGVLAPEGPIEEIRESFEYDIMSWLMDKSAAPLVAYRTHKPKCYRFFFTELQLYERWDAFTRYGTDRAGLVKILQRTASLHRLFRRVEPITV